MHKDPPWCIKEDTAARFNIHDLCILGRSDVEAIAAMYVEIAFHPFIRLIR